MRMSASIRPATGLRSVVLAVVLGLVTAPVLSAGTCHVWQDSPSPGAPYDTWETAAHDIQTAINYAVANDIPKVLLTNDTYVVGSQVEVEGPVTVEGVGGHTATTVMSSYPVTTNRCFYVNHEGALLTGLMISNGYVVASSPLTGNGGGVYLAAGRVQDCRIRWNYASSKGGGVYLAGTATVSDSTVDRNSGNYGSNVYLNGGGTVERSSLTYGAYREGGGGAYLNNGGVVEYCTITNNNTRRGGGVHIETSGTVRHCEIARNDSQYAGSGVRMISGGLLSHCIVTNNLDASEGGSGIHLAGAGVVRNCLIGWNSATKGAGINVTSAGGTIESCTIVGNNTTSSSAEGVGVRLAASATVENCVIRYNTRSGTETNWFVGAGVTPVFSHVCTTPTVDTYGSGNTTGNPTFVNYAARQVQLVKGSVGIDAGVDRDWMQTAIDLDGNRRKYATVDMGAYELPGPLSTLILVH